MEKILAYLKAVIEGEPEIQPWKEWFETNDSALQKSLPRTKYLDLKLNRYKGIAPILTMFGIPFEQSDRYAYLGGIAGRFKDCGAVLAQSPGFDVKGGFIWCPNGCFRIHALRR